MKLLVRPLGTIELASIGESENLTIKGFACTISILDLGQAGFDITVNPSGKDYQHKVRVHEVVVNSSQVRLAGVNGSAL